MKNVGFGFDWKVEKISIRKTQQVYLLPYLPNFCIIVPNKVLKGFKIAGLAVYTPLSVNMSLNRTQAYKIELLKSLPGRRTRS